jgi:hypothetical protein
MRCCAAPPTTGTRGHVAPDPPDPPGRPHNSDLGYGSGYTSGPVLDIAHPTALLPAPLPRTRYRGPDHPAERELERVWMVS